VQRKEDGQEAVQTAGRRAIKDEEAGGLQKGGSRGRRRCRQERSRRLSPGVSTQRAQRYSGACRGWLQALQNRSGSAEHRVARRALDQERRGRLKRAGTDVDTLRSGSVAAWQRGAEGGEGGCRRLWVVQDGRRVVLSGFSGSCPHVKRAQCSGSGCARYRQRLSGLGGIDAGGVGWRGCGVEGTIAAVVEEDGGENRAARPGRRPGVFAATGGAGTGQGS
jgi:hypothetical protein